MTPFRTLIRIFLSNSIKRFTSGTPRRNYTKFFFTTGILGLSSFFLWKNFPNKFIYPLSFSPSFLPPLSQRNKDHNFIANVTKKCAPSVVAIEVKNSMRLSPETGQPILSSTGSGFVVNNGWVLTNAHVVMNKPNAIINVVTLSGETYPATVQDIDLKLDLALLKIPSNDLPPLALGNSQDVFTGEWVVALGSPLSLRHTITAGVVSSVNRDGKELGIINNSLKYLQTDAAITFGHSGGPLVNLDGEVIGVNNLRITAGIAFAIPVDYVKEFLTRSHLYSAQNAKKQETINNPIFGITTLALTDQLLVEQQLSIPKELNGVFVWNVANNSPAYNSGLIAGDIITAVNNESVSEIVDLYLLLLKYQNDNVTFTVYRKGLPTEMQLKVKHKTNWFS